MNFSLFHPAVSTWFQKHFEMATEIQKQAWPEIKKNQSVLIAAPTGSGKTLASFLSAIDDLVRQQEEGFLQDQTQVVYVSPLKALSNDIERNLQVPLKGISEEFENAGKDKLSIRVSVRTGDTSQADRASMNKKPPHILVTTPESLYLLLTSVNGRKMLSSVRTLIVDEIHAIVGSKRGSHLALSMERLEKLTGRKLLRIGISATQKPIERIADFLIGNDTIRSCKIIDTGHKRKMELSLEVPGSPLTAVMAHEVWGEIYERLEELILQHDTTLIFVNTRRLAERLSMHLSERLGQDTVMAHHGSMSREQRFDAEQRLKSGSLKALVATASLELGIDIGSVDLVCQIGMPRSIATFLQRVGRSGHSISGTPNGKIFPLTRDELVECTALLDAVRRGELDAIIIPDKPIDVMAQQIVAEVASNDSSEDEIYELIKKADPYKNITRKEFDEVVEMLSNGFTTRRGKRGAHIFHDIVNKELRARKGARLTAIFNGSAIPDNFDFDVIKEPENAFVGTLNEDFAIESLPGDIFQLGNTSYRILRVENGKVKVEDAQGQPPSLPFWLGEGPGRTKELSFAVSRLRAEISERLKDVTESVLKNAEDHSWKEESMQWLMNDVGIPAEAADQLVVYLALAKVALGVIPTQNDLVLERFFDEAGDMHLVVHSPFGNRVNRAWGLSLRKRFCKKCKFELQAAATEDAVILSLGSTHSFVLEEVFGYLKSASVKEVLIQALLDSPMFEIRWRWNASCALAIIRKMTGKKVPPQLQRMQAEDLVALVFPDQLACFENIQGEREVPDHPLVNQTIHDCLTEAMNLADLEQLLKRIELREVGMHAKDLREPSPLAQEILTARPYAFLDDAPLEERRTRAVMSRRWLDPSEADDLGRLDPAAIDIVKSEAWPEVSSVDEMQDALATLGYILPSEIEDRVECSSWPAYLSELASTGRACVVSTKDKRIWVAVERLPQFQVIYPELTIEPKIEIPRRLLEKSWTREEAIKEIIRGRLEGLGPVTEKEFHEENGIAVSDIHFALLNLEQEGFVFRGKYRPGAEETEWCERRLLARIHRYTLQKLRKEIEPVSPADFMRFLFEWHGLTEDNQPEGAQGVERVLSKLEGFEAPAAAWEADLLPARVANYDHHWLDQCCLSGKIVWGRFVVASSRKSNTPIKTSPIMLVQRRNAELWKECSGAEEQFELSAKALAVYEYLKEKGAVFFDDLVKGTMQFDSQCEDSLAELVSYGLVSSDSFNGLRALLVPAKYKLLSSRKNNPFTMDMAGRWTVITHPVSSENDKKKNLEFIAKVLLKRYGVIFRKLAEQESITAPWRELVRVYRSLEAKGEIRGGRFVDGVWGEQFALPETISQLRELRRMGVQNKFVAISACDPLNLVGIITPGKKVTSYLGNRILFRDGIPVVTLESDAVNFLIECDKTIQWEWQELLIKRKASPILRSYLGKYLA